MKIKLNIGQKIKQKEEVLQGGDLAKATLPKDAMIQGVHKNSKTGKVYEQEIHWDTKQTTVGVESSMS